MVPLKEIIAESLDKGISSLAVKKEYDKLIKTFDSEFNVLLDASIEEIGRASSQLIGEGVKK